MAAKSIRKKKPVAPSRLMPTFMDSAILALVPALIIGMILSLLYFLVLTFYRGDFDIRLMYLLSLFTSATVLIALIAVESGRAHANLFSLPLGLAAYVAIARFVTASGPLAPLSWLINLLLLGFAWWLADRITLDCAVFDSRQSGSRQGLLQSLGLLRKSDTLTNSPRPDLRTDAYGKPVKVKAKRHNQGVWVLYFSLLALPLFGLGQLLLPEQSVGTGFVALMCYLGCSMSLLTATSFLSMRRYVRQKGVEMPAEISRSWLGSAIAAVTLLLVICLVLPLPGRNMGLISLPLAEAPEDLQTSRWGWGNEAKQGEDGKVTDPSSDGPPGSQTSENGKQPGNQQGDGKGKSQAKGNNSKQTGQGKPGKDGRSGDSQGSEQASSNRQSNSNGQGPKNQTDDASSEGESNRQTDGQDNANNGKQTPDNSKESQSADKGQNNRQTNQSQNENAGGRKPDDEGKQSQNSEASPENENQSSSSKPSPSFSFSIPSNLGQFIKWLTFAALAVIVVGYAVTHPTEVRQFWQRLLEMIAALFGGKPSQEKKEATEVEKPRVALPPQRPFADFENPFYGTNNWSPAKIVTHTYAAMQAWGAEHDAKCHVDWTATEYAKFLAARSPGISKHGQVVARFFDRVMFGGWQPSKKDTEQLRTVWDIMSS